MIGKMDGQGLIFLHIAKTMGTTLNQIIGGQCGPLSIFTLNPYRIRATAKRFGFQCRLVVGVEETAIGDERLLEIAKTFGWGAPF